MFIFYIFIAFSSLINYQERGINIYNCDYKFSSFSLYISDMVLCILNFCH